MSLTTFMSLCILIVLGLFPLLVWMGEDPDVL